MMTRIARGNWRLLAVCGALNAIIAAIYVVMFATDRPPVFHSWQAAIAMAGELGIVAGLCAIAAGVLAREGGGMWPLAVNGAALATLGFVQYAFVRRAVSILAIAVLVSAMAVSLGVVEIRFARRTRHSERSWLFAAAGAVLIAFTLPSAAFGLRWVPLRPNSHPDLLWLAAYFALAAFCFAGLAGRAAGLKARAG